MYRVWKLNTILKIFNKSKINCRKIIKVLWNKLQLKHTMKKEWDATDQI